MTLCMCSIMMSYSVDLYTRKYTHVRTHIHTNIGARCVIDPHIKVFGWLVPRWIQSRHPVAYGGGHLIPEKGWSQQNDTIIINALSQLIRRYTYIVLGGKHLDRGFVHIKDYCSMLFPSYIEDTCTHVHYQRVGSVDKITFLAKTFTLSSFSFLLYMRYYTYTIFTLLLYKYHPHPHPPHPQLTSEFHQKQIFHYQQHPPPQ